MEKLEIRNKIIAIKSVEDLAELLNGIKQDEFGMSRYEITGKQLKFYSSDKNASKRYRTFHLKKKSGGLREIKAPCYQLNIILRMLNLVLGSVFEPDSVAMGFASGRSVVNNAQVHTGHNYVFNIDLKDFFPSIPQARVWKRLQLAPFNFSQEIANVIAGLCCSYNEERDQNVLPQGAPTSPLLTNAICCNLDRKMKGVAKRFGLHYSRYADDMTFSSMHNVYQETSEFRTELLKIISEQGFIINDEKTRLLKTGYRQEVTGLIVNAKTNVSRKYVKEIRWILNVWEKYGYAKAYALFYPRYKAEKGYIKKGEPVMENVVGGKLDYLRMVRGASNSAYKKLKTRYDKLQQIVFLGSEEEQTEAKKFMYVQPYNMSQFEEWFNTKVNLTITKNGKLVGKCSICGKEKTLSISHATQNYLCPNLTSLSEGTHLEYKKLENCNVILCRAKGKNFWMISNKDHKRDKVLSIQNVKIDPSDLLDIWGEKGFKTAAEELALFIEFGNKGDNIKDFNPLLDSEQESNKDKFLVKNLKSNNILKEHKSISKDFKPNDSDPKSD